MSVIFKTLCLFTVGASQRVCLFSLFFFSVSLFSSHVSPLLVWSSDPVADRVSLTHSLFLPLSLFSSFVWLRASLSRPLFSLIPSSLLFLLSLLSLSRAGGVWLSSKPWATEPLQCSSAFVKGNHHVTPKAPCSKHGQPKPLTDYRA